MSGAELVGAGFVQISAKYRMLGRVPPGESAKDALYSELMKSVTAQHEYWAEAHRKWVDMMGEDRCASHYARVYASGDNALTVSRETFADFKLAGGRTA